MANWTNAQICAMNERGRMMLVSAAAGSGKTSVLTERIIRRLTDKTNPADLSRLLIVTFTRAAAAEMKSRIASALTEQLAQDPGNEHLSRQLFLLGSAQISTIDAFFLQGVKNNFEKLGLPASFRLADAGELYPLALDIMEETVRDCYRENEVESDQIDLSDPFFRLFGNRFAEAMNHLMSGRSDGQLPARLLSLFERFAPFPEGIRMLKENAEQLRKEADLPFLQSTFGRAFAKDLRTRMDGYREAFFRVKDYLDAHLDESVKFSGTLDGDLEFVQSVIRVLDTNDLLLLAGTVSRFSCPSFPRTKNKSCAMADYHLLRNRFKEDVTKDLLPLVSVGEDRIREQTLQTADFCECIYDLFSEFSKRFTQEKLSRSVLEFNDIRSLFYRLLTEDKTGAVIESVASLYDEIYIDEYQDVDPLQDEIFSIIGKDHRFMVGDIKQSIYGFRGSEPSVFASYRKMPLLTDPEAKNAKGICVFMSDNFRCDRPIIEFTNRICSFLFSASEESVGYRPQDDLICSKEGSGNESVKLCLFEKPEKGKEKPILSNESLWVAEEIDRLLHGEIKGNGEPIEAGDVAILVRSASTGAEFAQALEQRGIPVSASGSKDLLHTPVMTDWINLLRAIDNPYRDLPLSEFLLSPVGGFSLTELTEIRASAPMHKSLFDAMTQTATGESPLSEKASEWVSWMASKQTLATVQPADRLLRLLFLDEKLKPLSDAPEALLLYEQARIYQRSSFCGLFGFLSHIDRLLAGKPISADGFLRAKSAVNITTIHHSKGLEFPVVFLVSVDSPFNRDSLKQSVIFHPSVGCTAKLYRPENSSLEDTVLRQVAKTALSNAEAEENIRVLYVALTRARERLYVTGSLPSTFEKAVESASVLRKGFRDSILGASSYLAWILGVYADCKRAGLAFEADLLQIPADYIPSQPQLDPPKPIAQKSAATPPVQLDPDPTEDLRAARDCDLSDSLEILRNLPTKAAASKLIPDLVDRIGLEDDAEALKAQIELMKKATPDFDSLLQAKTLPTAEQIGTATHEFLQFCDLEHLPERTVEAELDRLVQGHFLSEHAASLVNKRQLKMLQTSDLMQSIRLAQSVLREQKFDLLVPLSSLTKDEKKQAALLGQDLFVQGSIDLILIMPNGEILLYDYKTDHVSDEERQNPDLLRERFTERHGNQLACYSRAIKRLYGREPSKIFLYSLPLGKSVEVIPPRELFK